MIIIRCERRLLHQSARRWRQCCQTDPLSIPFVPSPPSSLHVQLSRLLSLFRNLLSPSHLSHLLSPSTPLFILSFLGPFHILPPPFSSTIHTLHSPTLTINYCCSHPLLFFFFFVPIFLSSSFLLFLTSFPPFSLHPTHPPSLAHLPYLPFFLPSFRPLPHFSSDLAHHPSLPFPSLLPTFSTSRPPTANK